MSFSRDLVALLESYWLHLAIDANIFLLSRLSGLIRLNLMVSSSCSFKVYILVVNYLRAVCFSVLLLDSFLRVISLVVSPSLEASPSLNGVFKENILLRRTTCFWVEFYKILCLRIRIPSKSILLFDSYYPLVIISWLIRFVLLLLLLFYS